ncbi:MAG: hypothetical protein V1906_00545 [Candidatus Woesearchaeota archaeon]
MHTRHNYLYVQLAIILTLIIMVGYITLYLYSTSNGDKTFKLTSDACHELGGTCRTSCNDNEVRKTKCDDMLCCVQAYPASPKDRIYLQLAESEKNISYCNKIIDEEMKASCKLKIMDMLNADFAIKYRDRKYCSLIDDEAKRNECIARLAKELYDIAVCNDIDILGFRYKCVSDIAIEKKDAMLCLKIPSEVQQNTCLKEIAIQNKEQGLCSQITMPTEVIDCKIKIELIGLSKEHINCVKLPESVCTKTKACTAVYFTPECINCITKKFEICLPNNDMFCENTFGSWNALEEKCSCGTKAWFEGFGCYGCDEFKEESSVQECQRRLA